MFVYLYILFNIYTFCKCSCIFVYLFICVTYLYRIRYDSAWIWGCVLVSRLHDYMRVVGYLGFRKSVLTRSLLWYQMGVY